MKKIIKLILIIIPLIIILDTLQAIIFDNSTIIKKKVMIDEKNYVEKGLLINTYYCINNNEYKSSKHIKFKKYNCPVDEKANAKSNPFAMNREKIIEINVPIPNIGNDVELKVYIDNKIDNSMTTTINSIYVNRKNLKFKDTSGIKEVRIKLNDKLYQVYELNFDNKTYELKENYAL